MINNIPLYNYISAITRVNIRQPLANFTFSMLYDGVVNRQYKHNNTLLHYTFKEYLNLI